MYLKVDEAIVTPNNDGTYKVEFPNVDFTDEDGNIIKGTITVPRATNNGNPLDAFPIDLEAIRDTMFTITVEE